MLKTSTLGLFESAELNMNSAVINLCDCFGNVSCQNNIMFRVKYPGAYAADLRTRKGDKRKLGTVSFAVVNGIIAINAYVCYNFTDQRSIMDGTLFDFMNLLSCMYQVSSILADFPGCTLFISSGSFIKFDFNHGEIIRLMDYICKSFPNDIVLTV